MLTAFYKYCALVRIVPFSIVLLVFFFIRIILWYLFLYFFIDFRTQYKHGLNTRLFHVHNMRFQMKKPSNFLLVLNQLDIYGALRYDFTDSFFFFSLCGYSSFNLCVHCTMRAETTPMAFKP